MSKTLLLMGLVVSLFVVVGCRHAEDVDGTPQFKNPPPKLGTPKTPGLKPMMGGKPSDSKQSGG
ncbi:MAG TPA: hypothetical protein VNI20_11155 [Fimbriimonadaceae bacterium]|nr:hypothetical protein [Fimbriimonadaceae bacterium]